MSSPTERAAAGGGAAARPESPADHPQTAVTARPERAPGDSGPVAADGGTPDRGAADRAGTDEAGADDGGAADGGARRGPVGQGPDDDDGAGHGDADHGPGDHGSFEVPVFLRAGRAGLAPEAVTVVGQPGDDARASPLPSARPDVAGLPPWADELPSPEPDTVPPWEAGPWPSYEPSGGHPGRAPAAAQPADRAPWPGADPAAPRPAGSGYAAGDRHDRGLALRQPVSSGPHAGRPADPSASRFAGAPDGDVRPARPAVTDPAALSPAPAADAALDAFVAGDTALDAFPAVGASLSPGAPATGPAPAADGRPERPDWPLQAAPAASPARAWRGGAGPASSGPASGQPARSAAGSRAATSRPATAAPGAANPLGTAALTAGILGIAVLPGVILGILGLRRATITGTGRLQSWLGIALSLLWAAGIVVLVQPRPGPASDPGCVQYRATGTAAVARVTSALRRRVAAGQLRAGLGPAGDAVNDATASAQNIDVRDALAALSSDLQAEQAAARGARPAPAALGATLARDAAAAVRLCGASS
jgi:hypothetical protein